MADIRLLLDADVDLSLAEALRTRGHDAVSALRVGLTEAEDDEILQWAVREERAVLTHNTCDFVPLAKEYAQRGWEHHGIIVSNRVPLGAILTRTLRLLGRKQAEDLRNAVEYLQSYR